MGNEWVGDGWGGGDFGHMVPTAAPPQGKSSCTLYHGVIIPSGCAIAIHDAARYERGRRSCTCGNWINQYRPRTLYTYTSKRFVYSSLFQGCGIVPCLLLCCLATIEKTQEKTDFSRRSQIVHNNSSSCSCSSSSSKKYHRRSNSRAHHGARRQQSTLDYYHIRQLPDRQPPKEIGDHHWVQSEDWLVCIAGMTTPERTAQSQE